jgi:hypothetical protein
LEFNSDNKIYEPDGDFLNDKTNELWIF